MVKKVLSSTEKGPIYIVVTPLEECAASGRSGPHVPMNTSGKILINQVVDISSQIDFKGRDTGQVFIIGLAQRVSRRKNRKDLSPLARCAIYT
jgi:hypothetical protein